LDGYDYIGVGRDDGKERGEYAAIFYKKDQLRLLDSGNFWLSPTPEHASLGWDAACIRICTWGKFQDKTSGKQFLFFNTHMDHVGVIARREPTLDTIISGRGVYKLSQKALDDYPSIEQIQSKGHKFDIGSSAFKILKDIVFFEEKPNDGRDYVEFLGLLNLKRVYFWIDKRYINPPQSFHKYKVIIPQANGSGALGEAVP